MFLIKIFHFAKGYVILSVSGHNKEEFLNAFIAEGARLRNTRYSGECILTEIPAEDFFLVRRVKTRVKLHICEKHGAVFVLRRMKKRIGFLIGMLALLLIFMVGSQFIWTVEYDGAETCDMQQLSAAVRLSGLYEGALKRNLKTPIEMKNIILGNTDDICWAWV